MAVYNTAKAQYDKDGKNTKLREAQYDKDKGEAYGKLVAKESRRRCC